jgi:hypothetical protein
MQVWTTHVHKPCRHWHLQPMLRPVWRKLPPVSQAHAHKHCRCPAEHLPQGLTEDGGAALSGSLSAGGFALPFPELIHSS